MSNSSRLKAIRGWVVESPNARIERKEGDATYPRDLSSDPAFGDFNLPLESSSTRCVAVRTEDEIDLESIIRAEKEDDDDLDSYEVFRRDELGL